MLKNVDMAETEQGGPAPEAFRSFKSLGDSQKLASKLTRHNTFAGGSEIKHDSDSEEEEDTTFENKALGMSLTLDQDEGPSQGMGSSPLDRFRSSMLE